MKHELQKVTPDIQERLGKPFRWRCLICGDMWFWHPHQECDGVITELPVAIPIHKSSPATENDK